MKMSGDESGRIDLGMFGWLNRILVVLIVASVIAVAAMKYVPLIRTNIKLVRREQELLERVAAKKAQSIRLAQRIRQLRENPRVIEREARAQLGLAKSDEMVLWISSPATRGESLGSSPTGQVKDRRLP